MAHHIMKIMFNVAFLCVLLSSCQSQQNDIKVLYMSDPCLIPTKDNRFKTCEDMVVRVDDKVHIVPKGFKTDLASIPRVLWPIFSPGDYDVIAPAVLHDWHYCCSKEVSRQHADDIFYFGLVSLGMSHKKAYFYYISLRALGGSSYKFGEDMDRHVGQFALNAPQGVYKDESFGLVKVS